MNPDVATKDVNAALAARRRFAEPRMVKACMALTEAGPGATWVKEMAPLNRVEQEIVRDTVAAAHAS